MLFSNEFEGNSFLRSNMLIDLSEDLEIRYFLSADKLKNIEEAIII